MVKGALLQKPNTPNTVGLGCINTSSVLLLLSVQNVDKPSASIDQYGDRLVLIEKMAKRIREDLGVECGVCLLKCGRFIDKSLELDHLFENEIGSDGEHHIKMDYLLGYDTVVRLFDSKYYEPSGDIEQSLDKFISNNHLTIFLREDGKTPIETQRQFLTHISQGEIKNVPTRWSKNMSLAEMKDSWWISSSLIRQLQKDNDPKWHSMVVT